MKTKNRVSLSRTVLTTAAVLLVGWFQTPAFAMPTCETSFGSKYRAGKQVDRALELLNARISLLDKASGISHFIRAAGNQALYGVNRNGDLLEALTQAQFVRRVPEVGYYSEPRLNVRAPFQPYDEATEALTSLIGWREKLARVHHYRRAQGNNAIYSVDRDGNLLDAVSIAEFREKLPGMDYDGGNR